MMRRSGAIAALTALCFSGAAQAEQEVAPGLAFDPPPGATLRVTPSLGWLHWQAAALPAMPPEGVTVRMSCRFEIFDFSPFGSDVIPVLGGFHLCNPTDTRMPRAEIAPFVEAARRRSTQYQFDLSQTPSNRQIEYRPIVEFTFRPTEIQALDLSNRQYAPATDLIEEYPGRFTDAELLYAPPSASDPAPEVELHCIVVSDYSFACESRPRDAGVSAQQMDAAMYGASALRALGETPSGESTLGRAMRIWVRFFDANAPDIKPDLN